MLKNKRKLKEKITKKQPKDNQNQPKPATINKIFQRLSKKKANIITHPLRNFCHESQIKKHICSKISKKNNSMSHRVKKFEILSL